MTKQTSQFLLSGTSVSQKSKRLATTALAVAGLVTLLPGTVRADESSVGNLETPVGEVVVGGSADFSRPQEGTLNIDQHSDRVVINWDTFNIGHGATTQFFQPGSGSLAVNRVVGRHSDPSYILGTLKANGRVMVLDRNGVFFGKDSIVDVGGIIASTGDVDTAAVMSGIGNIQFTGIDSNPDAKIVLNGTVNVADAGLAAFVAPSVVNNGVINAKLGKVSLASGGDRATLDLYGDGLVEIALDGQKTKALVENNGEINAEGGTVALTASAAKEAVDDVINMSGVIKVTSVTQKGGKIILSGGEGGNVIVKGKMDASGKTGGGDIKVTGKNILIDTGAELLADATELGDGGNVFLYADGADLFYGTITARGGALGGNGGFVETSGYEYLDAFGSVDASAANGEAGLWLLDPLNITISDNTDNHVSGTSPFTPNGGSSRLNVSTLSNALNAGGGTNVVVKTTGTATGGSGDITIDANILKSTGAGDATLTLDAAGNIVQNVGKSISSLAEALNISFMAGKGITLNGTVNTNGGYATFDAAGTFTANNGSSVTTANGAINVFAKDVVLGTGTGNRLNAGSGIVTIARSQGAGNGDISIGDDNGGLKVSQAELGKIAASHLVIGRAGADSFDSKITIEDTNFGFNDVTLNTRNASGGGEDIVFQGANTANVLNVNADDNVVFHHVEVCTGFCVLGVPIEILGGALVVTNASLTANGDVNIAADTDGDGNGRFSLEKDSKIDTNGHNIFSGGYDTTLANGAYIDAGGGNIALHNTNTFSANADSIRTTGTGNISLDQNGGFLLGFGGNIQNAIDAIQNGGSGLNTINVGAGTYVQDVTVGKGNINLRGANAGIDGNGVRGAETLVGGITISGSGDTVDGFSVAALSGTGFTVNASAVNATVKNNTVLDAVGVLDNGSTGLKVTNNKFTGLVLTGTAVSLNGSKDAQILNNSALLEGGNGYVAVGGSNVTFEGNAATGTGGDAFHIEGTDGALLKTNTIAASVGNGIYVGDKGLVHANNVTADGNTVTVTIGGTDGIKFVNATNSTIKNNTLDLITGNGISAIGLNTALIDTNHILGAVADGILVQDSSGVTVNHNDITGVFGHGIHVTGANAGALNKISANTITAALNGNSDAIHADHTNNLSIEGGNSILVALGNAIGLDTVTDTKVDANHILGAAKDGILSKDSSGVTISGNDVTGVTGHGIHVTGANGGLKNVVKGNTITAAVNPASDAIHADHTNNLSIEGGNSVLVALGNAIGLDTVTDTKVDANHILGAAKDGILSKDSSGVTISGNDVTGVTGHGIHVTGANGGLKNVVKGNTITAAVNPASDAIHADHTNNLSIEGGNSILVALGNAIGLDTVTDTKVDANHILGAAKDGILSKDSSGVTISGNDVTGVLGNGIHVTGANGGLKNTVSGNTIIATLGAAGDAIRAENTNNLDIKGGNTVLATFGNGIGAYSVTDTLIDGNFILGAAKDGILSKDSSSVTISGNTVAAVFGSGIHVTGANAGGRNTVSGNIVGLDLSAGSDAIYADHTNALDINGGNTVVASLGNAIGVDIVTDVNIDNNHVLGAGKNGVSVLNSGNVSATGNDIAGVLGNGMFVDPSVNVTLAGNTIIGAGAAGIFGTDTNGLFILGNTILGAAGNGIDVNDSAGAVNGVIVAGNNVFLTGGDGISLDGTSLSLVAGNIVGLTGGDGISVSNSALSAILGNVTFLNAGNGISADHDLGVLIGGNTAFLAGGNGINATDSALAGVLDNTVLLSANDGIHADGVLGLAVTGNNVLLSGKDGIDAANVVGGVINSNIVTLSGQDGIRAGSLLGGTIDSNIVTLSADDGIALKGGALVEVKGNIVSLSDTDGIRVDGLLGGSIGGNIVTASGTDGIALNGGALVGIDGNIITLSGNDGIHVNGLLGGSIGGNIVTASGTDGIALNGGALVDIGGNIVSLSGNDGIHVNGLLGGLINGNIVTASGTDGIALNGGALVGVNDNVVSLSGNDGIHVNGLILGSINDNFVTLSGTDGVALTGGVLVDVEGNIVSLSGNDGIDVRNSGLVGIDGNFITLSGNNGIDVRDSALVGVTNNLVTLSGHDGIFVDPSVGINIAGNFVALSGTDGIHAEDVLGLNVGDNTVLLSGHNGIDLNNVALALVHDNNVALSGNNGIDANGTALLGITGNIVGLNGNDGIHVSNAIGTLVAGNLVGLNGHDGISLSNTAGSLIAANLVGLNGNDGIHIDNSAFALIAANAVGLNGNDGIDVENAYGVDVDANLVALNGNSGVEFTNVDQARLMYNFIADNGVNGSALTGGGNGSVVLAGNVLNDNPVGAYFESGHIDLTGATNYINGGDYGMVFNRFGGTANLSLQGTPSDIPGTQGTFGTTTFTGQSTAYIALGNNAFSNGFNNPQKLDVSYATFDGFTPDSKPRNGAGIPILTLAEYNALESMFIHFNDDKTLGLLLFGVVPGVNDFSVDQEDIFREIAGFRVGGNGFRITLRGMPRIGGGATGGGFNPASLANIAPAAGGDSNTQASNSTNPGDLADIAPAAGGNGTQTEAPAGNNGTAEENCWSDAVAAAQSGATVNYGFDGSADSALSTAAGCQSGSI